MLSPTRRDPKPVPRPRAKVVVRDLGTGRSAGVPDTANYRHTSFRLDHDDRRRLRELAAKRYRETGVKWTMSAVIRDLARKAATAEGIK